MKLRIGSLSITGRFRDNNEDAIYVDPQSRFFIVADGMGGQSAGERASGLVVELVPGKLDQFDFDRANSEQVVRAIDDAVAHVNFEIMALGELDSKMHNMGTTIVFAVRAGNQLYVGGVGDSRGYLLRKQQLTQLTTDHSLVQALIDAGTLTPEEALNHRYRNVLHRYLGSKEGGTGTHPKPVNLEAGDRLLLLVLGWSTGVGLMLASCAALFGFLRPKNWV